MWDLAHSYKTLFGITHSHDSVMVEFSQSLTTTLHLMVSPLLLRHFIIFLSDLGFVETCFISLGQPS